MGISESHSLTVNFKVTTASQTSIFKAIPFLFQTDAPFYRLEDMKVPTALWYAGNDWIVDLKDAERLIPQINNIVYKKYIPHWTHFDFIWGLEAPEQLYNEIVGLLRRNPLQNCIELL